MMHRKTSLLQKTLGKILESAGFNVAFFELSGNYSVDIMARSPDYSVIMDCMDSGYTSLHTLIHNLAKKQKIFNVDKAVLAFYTAQPHDFNVRTAEVSNVMLWGKDEIDAILDKAFEDRYTGKKNVLAMLSGKSSLYDEARPQSEAAAINPTHLSHPHHHSTISLNNYVATGPWKPDMDYIMNHIFTLLFQPGHKKIDGLKAKKGHFLAYKGKKPPYVLHTPILSDGVKYNLAEIDSLLGSIKQKEGEIDYLLAYTQIGSDLLKAAEKHNVRCLICEGIERKSMFSREPAFDRSSVNICLITGDDLVDYIKKTEKR